MVKKPRSLELPAMVFTGSLTVMCTRDTVNVGQLVRYFSRPIIFLLLFLSVFKTLKKKIVFIKSAESVKEKLLSNLEIGTRKN